VSAGRWASSGPDYSEQYLQQAQELARRFAVMEGVVGVLLTGGLTFGEADRYSDIDLIVYLRQQSLRTWYFGEAPLPEGESRYRNLRLDVSYLDYEHERERTWTTNELWGASRAEVLYDPEGLLSELLEEKLASVGQLADEALNAAARVRYLIERLVPAWLYRGEALAAHQVLNHAADELVRLIHLLNRQPGPEPGWDVALLDSLTSTPDALMTDLHEALRTGDLSAADASRRRYVLLRLLQSCWAKIAPGESFEDRADVVRQSRMLREFLERGSMPLSEFRERYDVRLLIQSPAFDLLWIDRQSNALSIWLNEDRLHEIVQHDLARYLDYQQRLLRELAESSGTDVDS
jgi:predicted nucleotidyltransferase